METNAAQTDHEAVEHKGPSYYLIWLILAVLTAAEVGVALLSSIPKTLLVVILIVMALWKAMLVAMYYMHLKFEPKKLWILTAAPLPLAVILVVIVLAEKW